MKKLEIHQHPWEWFEPPLITAGFKTVAGPLKIDYAYAIYPGNKVLLIVMETIGTQTANCWRRVWAPAHSAVEVAENLCIEAQEYLDSTPYPQRPYEDLGAEDFIEHLYQRLNDGLH